MHTVRWFSKPHRFVHESWLLAPSQVERDRITEAYDELVRRLCDDPIENSESRENGYRIAILSPLMVRFYIETEAQIVYITQAWLPGQLGGPTQ